MNLLMAIILMSAGAVILGQRRLITGFVPVRLRGGDPQTTKENLIIVGALLLLAGLAFLII